MLLSITTSVIAVTEVGLYVPETGSLIQLPSLLVAL
jgi:hypothetical protein